MFSQLPRTLRTYGARQPVLIMEPNTHTNTHTLTHTLQLLDKVDLHTWSCGSANDIMSRHRLDDEGPRLLKEVSFSTEQVCLDCNVIADREVTDTER